MGLVSEIAHVANITVRLSGTTELIAAADVPAFLDAARANRTYTILGLEGFRFVGEKLVPDMDTIADFASLAADSNREAAFAEALRFVAAIGSADLFFDIVVGQTSNSVLRTTS